MTPRDLVPEAEQRKAKDAAYRRASERHENTPEGMRATAKGLRDRARDISSAGDRAAMLRLASGFEARADALDARIKARITG
jgi:hypothetical protein